jgi:hypothetical protein
MEKLRELCRLDDLGVYVRCTDYVDNSSIKALLMGYMGTPLSFESSSTAAALFDKTSALEPHWRDFEKEWYISSISNGKNNIACGLKDYPC